MREEASIRIDVVDRITVGIGIPIDADGIANRIGAEESPSVGIIVSRPHPDQPRRILALAAPFQRSGIGEKIRYEDVAGTLRSVRGWKIVDGDCLLGRGDLCQLAQSVVCEHDKCIPAVADRIAFCGPVKLPKCLPIILNTDLPKLLFRIVN